MRVSRNGFHRFAQAERERRSDARPSGERRPASPAPYLICTNPRSGSWLLSEALTATGVAGRPREWFNAQQEQEYRTGLGVVGEDDLTYEAYLNHVKTHSATRNGLAGVKLHHYQLDGLSFKIETIDGLSGLTPARLMVRLFPRARYIWLVRRDKARQAVSFLIANESDEWWRIDGRSGAQHETQAPRFDPVAIGRLERDLVAADANWQDIFNDIGVQPLVVHYEDLAADYDGVVRSVLQWLEVPGAQTMALKPPRLQRQADARSEDWLNRYLAWKHDGEGTCTNGISALGVRLRQLQQYGRLDQRPLNIPSATQP